MKSIKKIVHLRSYLILFYVSHFLIYVIIFICHQNFIFILSIKTLNYSKIYYILNYCFENLIVSYIIVFFKNYC